MYSNVRSNSTWWQLNYRALFPRRTFFICWLIQLYVLDMLKFLNGSLSKLLKCWYCWQCSTTNTCICAARLISSSRSLSVEVFVCWPDPRKRLILWSILLAIDTVALSAKEIRCTAVSVTFGPRFLILVLLYRLLCSTFKSCAMLFPLPPLLLTDRFQ